MRYILPLKMLILTLIFTACSKKHHSPPSYSNCDVSAIYDTLGGVPLQVNLSYNANNQLAKLNSAETGHEGTEVYTYQGNWLLINYSDNYGSQYLADSIQFDDNGRIVYINRPEGSDTLHLHFYYNAGGDLIRSTSVHNQNSRMQVSGYQYTNGDITTEFDSVPGYPQISDTVYFTYYTDHAFSSGDYYAWQQFGQYGVWYWKSAHLLKSIRSYDDGLGFSADINYSFDAQGRATGYNATQNWGNTPATESIRFVYPCNP